MADAELSTLLELVGPQLSSKNSFYRRRRRLWDLADRASDPVNAARLDAKADAVGEAFFSLYGYSM